jgi:hypothetical protein
MTKKIISQCILCILSASAGLHAIDWSSAVTDGDWSESTSWTDGVVPTASDLAQIKTLGANVTVSTAASTNKLVTGHNSTITVSTGGTLTVTTDAEVGNTGNAANNNGEGTLVVDGGSVVTGKLILGKYNDTRKGTVTLNSGSISVGESTGTINDPTDNDGDGLPDDPTLKYDTKVVQIGGNNLGTGVMNIAGGNFTVYGNFRVGDAGAGTLNLSGGTLDLTAGEWHNLRVGSGTGAGTVNMTGGTLETTGLTMGRNNVLDTANFNLDGGTLSVIGSFGAAISLKSNSVLAISDGVFQWQGNMTTEIGELIESGNITFGNSTTSGNYPGVTPVQSWPSSDGAVTLYADYDGLKTGYTTVWAESNDTDGDGYNNSVDVFPDDENEWADSDGDRVGDNADVHNGFDDTVINNALGIASADGKINLSAWLATNSYTVDDGTSGGISQSDYDAALAAQDAAETALTNAREARAGSTVIDVANDLADITLRVEQTSDVSDWSSATTSDHTIQLSAPNGASFYRFTLP